MSTHKLYFCADLGTSFGRTVLVDPKIGGCLPESVFKIPAGYSEITTIPTSRSISKTFEDNMVFTIEDLNAESKLESETFFPVKIQVAKGSMLKIAGLSPVDTNLTTAKSSKTGFAVDCLNLIAKHAHKRGLSDVTVNVACALPVNERKRQHAVSELQKRLASDYFLDYPLLDFGVKIKITNNIIVESEAEIGYYNFISLLEDEKEQALFDNSRGIVIDIGKLTGDIAFFDGGVYMQAISDSIEKAGNSFCASLQQSFFEATGTKFHADDAVKFVEEGNLPFVINDFDPFESLKETKISYSNYLIETINTMMAREGWNWDTTSYVILLGRGVQKTPHTDEKYKSHCASIGAYMNARVKAISKNSNTKFRITSDPEFLNLNGIWRSALHDWMEAGV